MNGFRNTATSELSLSRALNTLLERPMHIAALSPGHAYTRRHDDTDGRTDPSQELTVHLAKDSDAWIWIDGQTLRFREIFGGGHSPRTRNALLVLAEAIRRDNEQFPQQPPQPPTEG